LGIAGGVDKDACHITDWWSLGAGFVEVGTVTPQPQAGHSGRRFDRNVQKEAVWNRLGFPSIGVEAFAHNLKRLRRPYATPVFVNVGKNKSTPLEKAPEDYLHVLRELESLADAFVINISSPNTAGLRDLLKPKNLYDFLRPLTQSGISKPLLLKVSPDVLDTELNAILDTSLQLGISGWILTNSSATIRDNLAFPSEGGVSGRPLADRSAQLLQFAVNALGSRKGDRLLISSGGVMNPTDVSQRLTLGADLVQVYSALVFSGPMFFRQVARYAQRLK